MMTEHPPTIYPNDSPRSQAMSSMPQPRSLTFRLLYPFRFTIPKELTGQGFRFDRESEGDGEVRPDGNVSGSLIDWLTAHEICLERDGNRTAARVWELKTPISSESGPTSGMPTLYMEEVLPHVAKFLFHRKGQRSGRYLAMPADTLNRLLNGPISVWPYGRRDWLTLSEAMVTARAKGEEANEESRNKLATRAPIVIDKVAGVELFILGFGVGVVSITFQMEATEGQAFELDQVRSLLYGITQRRQHREVTISRFHDRDDVDRWNRLLQTARDKKPQPPTADKPLAQRLGQSGGEIRLEEFCRLMIQPLRERLRQAAGPDFEAFSDEHQTQFGHYSVVQFDHRVEFSGSSLHRELTPELSSLTQLEEVYHAGMLPGEISVANRVLNSKHFTAVGSLGSAHFVADQHDPPRAFDCSRSTVVSHKYFIDFLLVYLQDQYLQKILHDTAELVALMSSCLDGRCGVDFEGLRADVVEFDSTYYVTRCSSREAHNVYYRLVQEGLQTNATFRDVADQIEDLDGICRLRSQQTLVWEVQESIRAIEKLGKQAQTSIYAIEELGQHGRTSVKAIEELGGKAQDSVKAIEAMQNKVEWVELFVISAYSVYLTNYIGENLHFAHPYIGWAIVVIAIIAAALAAVLLEPWRHTDGEIHPSGKTPDRCKEPAFYAWLKRKLTWYSVVGIVALLLLLYIGLGSCLFSSMPYPEADSLRPLSTILLETKERLSHLEEQHSRLHAENESLKEQLESAGKDASDSPPRN